MKVLHVHAGVIEEFKEESLEKIERFEEGKEVPNSIKFEDPTMLRKVLTEKRIELIQFLMGNEVESTSELAEKLGRGVKEVSKDLNLLEEYGIVELEKNGRSKSPSIDYNRIEIDIDIESDNQNQKEAGKGLA